MNTRISALNRKASHSPAPAKNTGRFKPRAFPNPQEQEENISSRPISAAMPTFEQLMGMPLNSETPATTASPDLQRQAMPQEHEPAENLVQQRIQARLKAGQSRRNYAQAADADVTVAEGKEPTSHSAQREDSFAVLITFPDYEISISLNDNQKMKVPNLGHGGILLINSKGVTKYFEYGRYDKEGHGIVRKIVIPNVLMNPEGYPDLSSLHKVFQSISKQSGKKGRIEGAIVKTGSYQEMYDYAVERQEENSNPEREKYSLFSTDGFNCGSFATAVMNRDEEIEKKAPSIFDPRPVSIAEEYQDVFDDVSYDPSTGITSVERDGKIIEFNSKTKQKSIKNKDTNESR